MSKISKTGTKGRIPTPTEMDFGELLLNYSDGKLFYKNHEGKIKSFNSNDLEGSFASFSWDSAFPSPNAVDYIPGVTKVTNIHKGMRRCLVKDDGSINYYLNPYNSLYKESGEPAVLTGADGQVMVEIPKFYIKKEKKGTIYTWTISDLELPGFSLHPAFLKDNTVVDNRYYGAYDACLYDVSASQYISGLNLDNVDSLIDINNDILSSVSGIYPIVGITRAQARSLASKRGAGWRQADFWLVQAIQILYLVEYQSFYSQNILGNGNTADTYVASSSNQEDSPHSISGRSNSLGNSSTNTLIGRNTVTNPPTAFMSYRGIENFFGNCWNYVDGFNINSSVVYVNNTTSQFSDDTATNYINIGTIANASGYPNSILNINNAILPATVGGSSSTYFTDHFWISTGWRVARFGGTASDWASAGAFCWNCNLASSYRYHYIGARLAR